MASIKNSIINYSNANPVTSLTAVFDGNNWEEVESFNSAVITVNYTAQTAGATAASPGTLSIEWTNSIRTGLPIPNVDVVVNEDITIANGAISTITRNHRGSWFRIKFTTPSGIQNLSISTVYKTSTSLIKITDEGNSLSTGIVGPAKGPSSGKQASPANNTFNETLSDVLGNSIRTTNVNDTTGSALCVNLRDSLGAGLSAIARAGDDTVRRSLGAGLFDGNRNGISTVKAQDICSSDLYVSTANSIGQVQATTNTIKRLNGTDANGVANYLALSDFNGDIVGSTATSNKDASVLNPLRNSLFTTLVDIGGDTQEFYTGDNGAHEPIWVDISGDTVEGINSFNIETGIKTNLSTITATANSNINLFNLFIYNNNPVTTWLKVYDLDTAAYNLNLPGGVRTVEFIIPTNPPILTNTANELVGGIRTITNAMVTQAGSTTARITFTLYTAVTTTSTTSEIKTCVLIYDTYSDVASGPITGTGWFVRQLIYGTPGPIQGNNMTLKTKYTVGDTAIIEGVTYTVSSNSSPKFTKDEPIYVFTLNQGTTTITGLDLDNVGADVTFFRGSAETATVPTIIKYNTTNLAVKDIVVTTVGTGYVQGAATVTIPDGTANVIVNVNITNIPSGYNQYRNAIKLNIPCPPKGYRDLTLLRGTEFKKGMYFRATYDHGYDSARGPETDNELFISGTINNLPAF